MLYEVPPELLNPEVDAKILVGFATFVTSLVIWGLHGTMPSWVRTMFSSLVRSQPGENIIQHYAYLPARLAIGGIVHLFQRTRHHTSHAVQLNSKPLEGWFGGVANLWRQHVGAIATSFEAVAVAVTHLRHVTIPRLIRVAVHPVARVADHALHKGIEADIGQKRANNALGHKGIDKLRRQGLWPVAAGLAAFDAFRILTRKQYKGIEHGIRDVRHRATHAQHTATGASRAAARANARARTLERTKVDKRGLALAVEAAIAAEFGSAFRCRSLKNLTKNLRCSSWRFLGDLLGIGLAYLAVVDPVVIGKTAVKAESIIDSTLKELADPPALATEASHLLADLLVGGVD